MPLRARGFWIDDYGKYRHPAEFVGSGLTPGDRIRVAKYLREGVVIATYRNFQCCLLGCQDPECPFGKTLGSSDRSDGTWVWREALAHYVAHHDIRLPDEFLDHVRSADCRTSHALPLDQRGFVMTDACLNSLGDDSGELLSVFSFSRDHYLRFPVPNPPEATRSIASIFLKDRFKNVLRHRRHSSTFPPPTGLQK